MVVLGGTEHNRGARRFNDRYNARLTFQVNTEEIWPGEGRKFLRLPGFSLAMPKIPPTSQHKSPLRLDVTNFLVRISKPVSVLTMTSVEPIVDGAPWAFIAVMGVTGAGKSTFIQTASGDQSVAIGHGLKSCRSILLDMPSEYVEPMLTSLRRHLGAERLQLPLRRL